VTRPKSRLLNLDIDLQKKGRGYSTIHSVRGVLRPAFQMAFVDDLMIRILFVCHGRRRMCYGKDLIIPEQSGTTMLL
jgi:hypothetical protein